MSARPALPVVATRGCTCPAEAGGPHPPGRGQPAGAAASRVGGGAAWGRAGSRSSAPRLPPVCRLHQKLPHSRFWVRLPLTAALPAPNQRSCPRPLGLPFRDAEPTWGLGRQAAALVATAKGPRVSRLAAASRIFSPLDDGALSRISPSSPIRQDSLPRADGLSVPKPQPGWPWPCWPAALPWVVWGAEGPTPQSEAEEC